MLHAIYSVSVTKTKLLVPFRLKILHQTYDVSRVRGQNSELFFTWDILLLYITDNGEIRTVNRSYVCVFYCRLYCNMVQLFKKR
jgi:hypothetical protein